MKPYNCILSEKPDALDGAIEWLDAELKKSNMENEAAKEVECHIRPFVIEIAKKQGILVKDREK
ncbi:MAG: hypothetical protein IJ733_14575 [Lachnospiraceae bacterium]|nr:hypothetical protein [Lachnospiraceae bacterium]